MTDIQKPRHGVRFTAEINLGHVLYIAALIGTACVFYFNDRISQTGQFALLDKQVEILDVRVMALESQIAQNLIALQNTHDKDIDFLRRDLHEIKAKLDELIGEERRGG